jgi:hypothetical protein
VHPSHQGHADAAGIGIGALWATSAERDSDSEGGMAQLPYGEGWARFGTDAGQLELRVTPGLGFVGYRFNIMSAQDDGVGVAIKPSLGTAYWKVNNRVGAFPSSGSALALAPSLSALFAFADGNAYVAPRLGYLHTMSFGDDSSESSGSLSFGANVGYIVDSEPFEYSLELGVQRVTSTEDDADGAGYVVVPSVGIQL